MAVQEDWRQLRQKADGMFRAELAEAFVTWAGKFTAEDEDDVKACFYQWRLLPEKTRVSKLRQSVMGGIPELGAGPQVELAVLTAMFQVLRGGRCLISLSGATDSVLIRAMTLRLQALDKLTVKSVGMLGERSSLKLADCQTAEIVFIDHYILITSLRSTPQLFPAGLTIFFIEIDICLYCNRLVFYDRAIPQASGLIYKSKTDWPAWAGNPAIFDTVKEMKRLGLEWCGCYSWIDKFTAKEMNKMLRNRIVGRMHSSGKIGFSAFTYRTSDLRAAALVRDVQKFPGHALVVCISEQVLRELQEAFRKSGVEFVVTAVADDVSTALSMAQPGKRRVILFTGLPTSQLAPPQQRQSGTLFLSECYLTDNYQAKMIAMTHRLMDVTMAPRLYFSLVDRLLAIYDEEAGLGRLFDLMEFTERYDPWHQIRRVLAKAILRKLSHTRGAILDDDAPLASLPLTNKGQEKPAIMPKSVRGAKVEAMCFCGSGKPFKECHGRKKSK